MTRSAPNQPSPKPAQAFPATAQAPTGLDRAAWSEELVEDALAGEPETREQSVSAQHHGQRLDRMLVAMAGEFSRSYLQQLVAQGQVWVQGRVANAPAQKLVAGQRVKLNLVPTAQSQAFTPQAMALEVVFEDEHLLVLNKPVGLVVHPAPGNWSGTLLNGLLARHPGAAQLPRAGIVHRLDKDTSGLMVVAKTLPAMTALVREIAARKVQRHYLALAHGTLKEPLCLEQPIGRDPRVRVRMAVVPIAAGGKAARTDVLPMGQQLGLSAIECRLHTGRTHQIRVHLAHAGHALVADAVYGGKPTLGLARQALHAARLAFTHPVSGQAMDFLSKPPRDFAQAWQQVAATMAVN